jgi:hypothetical protein
LQACINASLTLILTVRLILYPVHEIKANYSNLP